MRGWTDVGPVCLFRIRRRMRSGICISGTCPWHSPHYWCCWPQPTTLTVRHHSHTRDLHIKTVNGHLFSLFFCSDDTSLFSEPNLRYVLCCLQRDRYEMIFIYIYIYIFKCCWAVFQTKCILLPGRNLLSDELTDCYNLQPVQGIFTREWHYIHHISESSIFNSYNSLNNESNNMKCLFFGGGQWKLDSLTYFAHFAHSLCTFELVEIFHTIFFKP